MTIVNLTSTNKLYLWLLQCAAFAFVLVYLLINHPLEVNANLTSLFSGHDNDEWQKIEKKIDASANTSLLYLVGHPQQSIAIKAANLLAEQSRAIEGLASVTAQLANVPNQQMMIDSYLGYEQQLLTKPFRLALQADNKEQVFTLQFQLLNQLGDQLVSQTLAKDPSLAFANYLNRSPFPSNKIVISSDGYLTLHDDNITYVLVTMKTQQGAFNLNSAKAIVNQLNALDKNPAVNYIRTGAIFYSNEASEQAQWEMQWFGGLSILATLLLIFLSYRRIVTVFSTVFLIAISVVYGVLGLNLFFSEINVLSIVFAITLIGIAADYSFHSLTELQRVPSTQAQPLQAIKTSLILSFTTTALGYLLLVLVPIVIFKQIAVFTIFGLFGALITVLLLFPYLHQQFNFSQQSRSPFYKTIHRQHQKLLVKLQRSAFVFGVILLLSIGVLSQAPFSDDAKSFYQVSAQLLDSETKVKKLLGQKLDNQYLLTQAENAQQLLEREEQLHVVLDELKNKGVISGYQSVANWLPSISQQKQDNLLLQSAEQQSKFSQLSALLGQRKVAVAEIENYLLPKQWLETPLGRVFQHLWITDTSYSYSLIRFSGISDSKALSTQLLPFNNSKFVDKLADTQQELASFRIILTLVFIAACLAALMVFTVRYGIKKACYGVLVPASAFVLSLTISVMLQSNLTLFNLASGLVILALGLDYSVFYAEHGFSVAMTQTTFMSALSSIFVFAILSFSSTPAIASFGQTVFFGIVLTFLFSPMISQVSGKRGHNEN